MCTNKLMLCCVFMAMMVASTSVAAPKAGLVVVEDYRSDAAAEQLMARLAAYPKGSIELTPLRLNYKFITSDSFHAYFRNLLSMKYDTPDIFFIDQIYISDFVKSGFLADLSKAFPQAQQRQFLDFAIRPAVIDGKLWALPIHAEAGIIFYRKDFLNELGIDQPKTWDDIRNASIAIRKIHPEVYGYVGQFKEYEGLVCNFLEFAWSNGADPFEATLKDKQKLAEALQTLVDWISVYKIIPEDALEMTEGESIKLFQQNRALFLRHWPSGGLAWFKDAIASDKVGLMSLPSGPSGQQSHMVSGGWYFVVNAYSKNTAEAINALSFIDNERSQIINFETKREIPTRKSLYANTQIIEAFPAYFKYLASNSFKTRSRPQSPYYSEFSRVIASAVHKALKRQFTVAEAIDRIYTEMSAIKKGIASN